MAAPTPKPKPTGKGGSLFTKKIAGLPGWAWGAGALLGVLIGWYLMRNKGGTEADGSYGQITPGQSAGQTAMDAASGGAPSSVYPAEGMMDPAVLDAIEGLIAGQGEIGAAVSGLTDQYGSLTAGIADIMSTWGTEPIDVTANEPEPGSGSGNAGSPARSRTAMAITWGGSVYGAGTGDLFIREQLRPKGVNPATWARNHPTAAKTLGIKASPAVAKPKVTPKPPVRKPTAKPAPVRYYTYKKDVRLKPGQKLKFTTGKGYYAG